MHQQFIKSGIAFATLFAVAVCQGCFKLQRAAGCNNPGILGCKDKTPEIRQPDSDLQYPTPGVPFHPGKQNGTDQLCETMIEYCMTAGKQRLACIASLPPDARKQFASCESDWSPVRLRPLEAEPE